MNASLHALLTGIVDYAGLFPPAKLPLDQAIRNYARYRAESEAWMLGRFVISASQLGDLHQCEDLFQGGPQFALSVLGTTDPSLYRAGLEENLRAIKAFRERHGPRVAVDVLEMKLPPHFVEATDPTVIADWLTDIRAIVERAGFHDLAVFFECGLDGGERVVATVLEAIAIHNRDTRPERPSGACANGRRAGFKLRCGGLQASAFPTADQVAFVIENAVLHGVPLKATAGLHHPFRRFDASVQAMMHGFVNVFAAGVLSHTQRLDRSALVRLLNDDDAGHFAFDDTGLRWETFHATTHQIMAARRQAVLSFGSCSFDEPRDDLRALGWL
jgi:hypothetical protein